MSVLALENLSKSFGEVAAVRGVNLTLLPGGRTAIVGPSGCGKTTLLRLIAGFDAPTAGRILLDGEVIAAAGAATPTHLRSIGLVAQDGALFPHLTIAQNIGFGIPRGAPGREARIRELADLVGLSARSLARHPHELSGGQQQRVALARAMARKPRLMLLDEPFSSLDSGLRGAMCKAVVALLGEAGIASILVTHDRAEALSYGDQIAVMHAGAFAQVGPPHELYERPRNRRTAEFLGDAIILPARVAGGRALCALGAVAVDDDTPRALAPILLRPAQVRLVACPQGPGQADAEAQATVVEVDFGGAQTTVILRLSGPAPAGAPPEAASPADLSLRLPSEGAPAPGDLVSFRIEGRARVLEEDPPEASSPRGPQPRFVPK